MCTQPQDHAIVRLPAELLDGSDDSDSRDLPANHALRRAQPFEIALPAGSWQVRLPLEDAATDGFDVPGELIHEGKLSVSFAPVQAAAFLITR